jgi:hypothetical protein
MRFLILAHSNDQTALQVHVMLRARHGPDQVKLTLGEDLAYSPFWKHCLEDRKVTTELILRDGTCLTSGRIGVVFNRLLAPTVPYFASAVDQNYAVMEMYALYLSWLSSLPCPVVNNVSSIGLGVQTRSHAEWLLLAAKAGLPVRGFHFTSDPRWVQEGRYVPYRPQPNLGAFDFEKISSPSISRAPIFYLEEVGEEQETMLVSLPHVTGRLTKLFGAPLKRLARLAGCDLLQVFFAPAATNQGNTNENPMWRVCSITPFPHAQTMAEVTAIVQLLESKPAKTNQV